MECESALYGVDFVPIVAIARFSHVACLFTSDLSGEKEKKKEDFCTQ